VNPSTALARTLVDELLRCGLREVVIAPGSRSAPLAMEFHRRSAVGDLRLHVRVDERSAAFLGLGLAKVGLAPVAIVCTSGTAAAHFHAAIIEADESAVPLLVLTADRPPELRGTGANQTIDQLKLYGSAVRWFCELGAPDRVDPRYWRSTVARAWGLASGAAGGPPGPVHMNVALREPLVPDDEVAGDSGRPDGAPWTRFASVAEIDWTERGLIVCGDGDYDSSALLALAEQARWPVLAEPSSNARVGEYALSAYQYLIGNPAFLETHRPDVIISVGRPGLSRAQLALLRGQAVKHVVVANSGRWSDPARSATEVAAAVRLLGVASSSAWLASWLDADAAVRTAVDEVLGSWALSEPRLARDLAAQIPSGGLLWVASSQPVRDLDAHMLPRGDLRVVASRGASGIDGLVSSAIGAALAHQSAGGGPAIALLGDLALLHDSAGLMFGSDEPVPDICLVVANNDGGGIFSMLEQAAFPGPFERVFGTPHGTDLGKLAQAAGLRYARIKETAELARVTSPRGVMVAELKTERPSQAALRAALTEAAACVL
jgi:2-succinyl-5-enolpyruvyl-6-hydroxy-3-cyclohexene-1-carboxylate synthase